MPYNEKTRSMELRLDLTYDLKLTHFTVEDFEAVDQDGQHYPLKAISYWKGKGCGVTIKYRMESESAERIIAKARVWINGHGFDVVSGVRRRTADERAQMNPFFEWTQMDEPQTMTPVTSQ